VYNSTASLERKRSWMGRRCCCSSDNDDIIALLICMVAVGPAIVMLLEIISLHRAKDIASIGSEMVCGCGLEEKAELKQDRPPGSPLLTSQITYSYVDLRNHGNRACDHIWWIPPKDRMGYLF
jgi:hypothetical protein